MKKRFVLFSTLAFIIFTFSVFAQPKLAITSYCDVRLESCKAQDEGLALIQEEYKYDVIINYLYYFDTTDPQSSLAQIAVECANKQGMKQEYKQELQNNLDVLTLSALKEYANNIELVPANFSFCLDTQITAWDVLKEVKEAEEDGVTTAPSVRFNTQLYTGSQTYTSLKTLANEYLSITEESIKEKTEEQTTKPNEIKTSEEITNEEVITEEQAQQGQEELNQIEDPLFFRAIRQIQAWMIGLFQ
ncbi:MAG: thioredoxin domain-containing protein [Candidatus Woesearchaeota archaeon]|jgi:predicted DsbA family dithiol-disulfide isomerase